MFDYLKKNFKSEDDFRLEYSMSYDFLLNHEIAQKTYHSDYDIGELEVMNLNEKDALTHFRKVFKKHIRNVNTEIQIRMGNLFVEN